MANRKISDLTALTAPATGDLLPIVDISEAAAADKNKKITYGELLASAPAGSAAAPSFSFDADPNTGIFNPAADTLAFAEGGVEKARIDSSGRLGLGTSAPSQLLTIFNPTFGVPATSGSTQTNGAFRISAVSTSGVLDFGIGAGGTNQWIQSTDSNTLNLGYVLLLNPNGGNVGIGSTLSGNANNRLLVRSESASAITNVLLLNNGAANNNAGQGVRINLSGISETDSNIRYAYIEAATQTTGNDHYLAFGTNSNGSTPVERARIDSSGRLLVGTSTATANGGVLQVSNGITFPATAVACTDANTLDDYEEGTWTPSLTNMTTTGSPAYAGVYTKIGNLVMVNFYSTNQSGTTYTATANSTVVTGFPFTTKNTNTVIQPWTGTAGNGNTTAGGFVGAGGNATGASFFTTIGPSQAISFSLTYLV